MAQEHIFFDVPSPLSLLLSKFTVVSIGVSCDDVPGTVLAFVFFLAEALFGDDTGVADVDSTDFNSETGSCRWR